MKRVAAQNLAEWYERNPKGYIPQLNELIQVNVCVPVGMLNALLKEHNEMKQRSNARKEIMKD